MPHSGAHSSFNILHCSNNICCFRSGVWSDFFGMAKAVFSRNFQKGYILLYWSVFHRGLWLYASHQRAKIFLDDVYQYTVDLGVRFTCLPAHKNRMKFSLRFMSLGAWKLETYPCPGSSRGSGKVGVGDASQFPGWLMKWQIQDGGERCYKFSFGHN